MISLTLTLMLLMFLSHVALHFFSRESLLPPEPSVPKPWAYQRPTPSPERQLLQELVKEYLNQQKVQEVAPEPQPPCTACPCCSTKQPEPSAS